MANLQISIHLMLLFNLNSASVTALAAIISIHLMLLFNGLFPGLPIHILLNFNTSNVTIQQHYVEDIGIVKLFQYI